MRTANVIFWNTLWNTSLSLSLFCLPLSLLFKINIIFDKCFLFIFFLIIATRDSHRRWGGGSSFLRYHHYDGTDAVLIAFVRLNKYANSQYTRRVKLRFTMNAECHKTFSEIFGSFLFRFFENKNHFCSIFVILILC